MMAVIWLIFFIGICLANDVDRIDSCKKEIHYLDQFTIESLSLTSGSAQTCSNKCRESVLCTHWSWSDEKKECQLKYVPHGTAPGSSPETGFTSGERFCGSMFPALCPNQMGGHPTGAAQNTRIKISTNLTFKQCISRCGETYEGKIYIVRFQDENREEGNTCWCELIVNRKYGTSVNKYNTCTLPAREAPKLIKIDGNDTLMAGKQASFTCNFEWKKTTDQYLVPNVTFRVANAGIQFTKLKVNKIEINPIPKIKQLNLTCIVDNKGSKNSVTKLVDVEWNEINKITGDTSPAPGTNQTYRCIVDANTTPDFAWEISNKNGKIPDIKSQKDGNEITLMLETNYTNIDLTCYSTIYQNHALNDSKQISINIGKEKSSADESVGVIVGIISFLLLDLGIAGFMIIRKSKANRQRSLRYKKSIKRNNASNENLPDHVVLNKGNDLGKNIEAYVKSKTEVNAEFEALEHFVSKEVNETFAQAKAEDNAEHNRYKDILPFDSNVVKISKPTGDPKTTYFNASVIKFPTMKKSFIAAQAPKPNSFSNFWQMILDCKVSTIVMITGLNEGGKIKAHQYWPDMDNTTMKLDNNITINYESHSFPGTYYHRKLKVKDFNGKEREVNHIQTTAWLDMTAPKRSKILLDLVYQAQELADKNPDDPILVHCSAGVGRTGTFIAVYKLTADYHNEEVNELDVFSTVVEMRKQRVKMVQKPQQYSYVIKCLKHYVMAQESVYSNIKS